MNLFKMAIIIVSKSSLVHYINCLIVKHEMSSRFDKCRNIFKISFPKFFAKLLTSFTKIIICEIAEN